MHVAVCIVGYRNPADVTRCLAALSASHHRAFEVVVCENGGEAAHRSLAEAMSPFAPALTIRLLPAGVNVGYAAGLNRCFAASPDAGAWWVLNPDTEPAPNAMGALVERLTRGDVQAVGGVLHDEHGRVQALGGRWRSWIGRAVSLGQGTRLDDPVDAPCVEWRMTYVSGASLLFGRAFLTTVGPMPEDYFLYGEEIAWCERARALGLRFGFAPGARVLHRQGATTGSAANLKRRPRLPIGLDERNKVLITRDHHPLRLVTALPAGLLLAALRFGRAGAWRQLGWALGGWWDGVRGRRGPPDWLS